MQPSHADAGPANQGRAQHVQNGELAWPRGALVELGADSMRRRWRFTKTPRFTRTSSDDGHAEWRDPFSCLRFKKNRRQKVKTVCFNRIFIVGV